MTWFDSPVALSPAWDVSGGMFWWDVSGGIREDRAGSNFAFSQMASDPVGCRLLIDMASSQKM